MSSPRIDIKMELDMSTFTGETLLKDKMKKGERSDIFERREERKEERE